jgi:hypothetical protein
MMMSGLSPLLHPGSFISRTPSVTSTRLRPAEVQVPARLLSLWTMLSDWHGAASRQLICHSESLAAHILERLSGVEPAVGVWSLAGLCAEFTRAVGVKCSASMGIEKGIESMLSAVRAMPSLRFDAIIVDEAQDFRTHWWIAMSCRS